MRSLTPDEIDMVSGGDIVVNAPVYRDISTGLIFGGQAPPESNGTVNGQDFQSYYHKYDTPPVHNRHDLGSKLHTKSGDINLDQVYESSAKFGSHTVDVVYDKTTMTAEDITKATREIQGLTNAYSKLTPSAQAALQHLDNIVFTTQGERSFSQEDAHTFVFGVDDELRLASENFGESQIIHDAEHVTLWDQTHDLNQSRGLPAEVTSIQMQIDNSKALGLTATEVAYLQDLHDHPEKLADRVNAQP